MVVTATEFKTNLGRYLSEVKTEGITIKKNGKPVARLIPYQHSNFDSLTGLLADAELPDDFDGDYRDLLHEMRKEDYESID